MWGLELVGWGWSVGVCAGGFGVGGLRWSVVGCAFGFGVGGLGLVGRGLGWKVWGWWVGVGQVGAFVLGVGGLGLVGRVEVLAVIEWVGWGRSVVDGAVGLVGWGWSVMGCAGPFGFGGDGVGPVVVWAYRFGRSWRWGWLGPRLR